MAQDQHTAAGFTVPDEFDYQTLDLEGKGVLVTGGTTGIGRAIALLLADRGATVVVFGRHQKELDDALADLQANDRKAHGFTADQSKVSEVTRAFKQTDEQVGQLDIAIINAALAADSVDEMSLDEIQQVLNTNLLGYVACCKEALTRMKKNGSGHIVLIGSMSADTRDGGSSVYVATKSGIQGFSEAFRQEANELGIKVTLVEPGKVGSDMQDKKETHARQAEEQKMLKAEDIAACVYYCLTQPERCDVVEVRIRPHKQLI